MRSDAFHLVATDGSDEPFLAELFFQTRRGTFEPLGWDEPRLRALLASQHTIREAQYKAQFPEATLRKVVVDGVPVGRVDTVRKDGRLHLIDLAVLPSAQGKGLGSAVLGKVLEEADAAGLGMDLHVEVINPARRLYARAGFVEKQDDGVYLFMEREPAPLNQPSRRSA